MWKISALWEMVRWCIRSDNTVNLPKNQSPLLTARRDFWWRFRFSKTQKGVALTHINLSSMRMNVEICILFTCTQQHGLIDDKGVRGMRRGNSTLWRNTWSTLADSLCQCSSICTSGGAGGPRCTYQVYRSEPRWWVHQVWWTLAHALQLFMMHPCIWALRREKKKNELQIKLRKILWLWLRSHYQLHFPSCLLHSSPSSSLDLTRKYQCWRKNWKF